MRRLTCLFPAACGLPLVVLAAFAACGDTVPPSATGPGTLELTIVTTGMAPDEDGYVVHISGAIPRRVAANSTTPYNLFAGQHSLEIRDLALNCQKTGGSLFAFVAPDQITKLTIQVHCPAPGSLRVTGVTGGTDADTGYMVVVDGITQTVSSNFELTLENISAGPHEVALRDVAGNCEVSGGAFRGVPVAEQQVAGVAFTVRCAPPITFPPGEYLVVAAQQGPEHDLDLYLLSAEGQALEHLTDLPARDYAPVFSPDGEHIAFLRDLGSGPPSLMIYHIPSRTERSLGWRTTNPVSWGPDGATLIYFRDYTLYRVALADPTTEIAVANPVDGEGYWSPDGSRIAFTKGAGPSGNVWIMNADGTGAEPVTSAGWRSAGPWSPQSDRLLIPVTGEMACAAFGWPSPCYQPLDLAVVDPGTSHEQLIQSAYFEYSPAWARDGERILFTAYEAGQSEIFSVQPDGSGLSNLTRTAALSESWVAVGRIK
jgi:hypothetical protein